MNRRFLITLLLLGASSSLAAQSGTPVVRITAGTQAAVEIPRATAAYSLDPSVADVSFSRPELGIVGYREGTARIAIITPDGLETLDVVVTPRENLTLLANRSRSDLSVESRYDSWSERFDQRLSWSTRNGDRQTRLEVRHSALRNAGAENDQFIPWASYRVETPRYTLTLLDQWVSESVLTLDRRLVRGVHLDAAGFRLHAGYGFYSLLGETFLPKEDRERVLGLSYEASLGSRSSITPRVVVFDTDATGPDRSGMVGSLEYEYQRGNALKFAAEAALSRLDHNGDLQPGFALRSDYRSDRDQAWIDLRHRPSGFAGLRREVAGTFGDASWRRALSSSLDATANVSYQDVSIPSYDQTTTSSSLSFRYRLNPRWGLSTGGRYSVLEAGTSLDIEQFEIPLEVHYRRNAVGGTAEYRYIENSHRNEGGHLVRLSGYGKAGNTRSTFWAERQTNAPTLEVIFREQPDLALLLTQLGIIVSSPFELSRVLREHPALAELGFIEGVTVNLSPVSYRAGGSLSWLEREGRSFQLTTNYRRDEGIARTRESAVALVSYSHRLGGSLDLTGGYSHSFTRSGDVGWLSAGGWQLGIRKQFGEATGNGLSLFRRRGEISGYVFLDERAIGRFESGMTPVAGVEVVLDDDQRTRTDTRGFFEFERVPEGIHTVQADYESDKPFKFTTASPARAGIGETIYIGIAPVAGRLLGAIASDQEIPIDGVGISIEGREFSTTFLARGGRFSIDVPRSGAYQVMIDRASVPSGYSLLGIEPVDVVIVEGQPSRADFVLPAIRSIGGKVERRGVGSEKLPVEGAVVHLDGNGRTMNTDAEGRYLFRDVTPGNVLVIAEQGGLAARRSVQVPKGPAAIRNIDLLISEGLLVEHRVEPVKKAENSEPKRPMEPKKPAAVSSVTASAAKSIPTSAEPAREITAPTNSTTSARASVQLVSLPPVTKSPMAPQSIQPDPVAQEKAAAPVASVSVAAPRAVRPAGIPAPAQENARQPMPVSETRSGEAVAVVARSEPSGTGRGTGMVRMLQSGTHRHVSSAAATVRLVESRGWQAVLRNTGTFYEVLIGPFDSDQALGLAMRELEKEGIRSTAVITRTSPFVARAAGAAGGMQ